MRLKEEATVTLSCAPSVEVTAQWLNNYENQTTNLVNAPENAQKHHQQLQNIITNNNLNNARSSCGVIADNNSNHRGDDNRTAVLASSQQLRTRCLPAEDTITSMSVSSPDDSLLGDCEDPLQIPRCVDASQDEGEEDCEEEDSAGETESSSSSESLLSDSEDRRGGTEGHRQRRLSRRPCAGILNPNYPGFQRYAKRLHLARAAQEEEEEGEDEEEEEEEEDEAPRYGAKNSQNNTVNNNNVIVVVVSGCGGERQNLNQLDEVVERFDKSLIYEKSKLNIPLVEEGPVMSTVEREWEETEQLVQKETWASEEATGFQKGTSDAEGVGGPAGHPVDVTSLALQETREVQCRKMVDAYLSGAREDIGLCVVANEQMGVTIKTGGKGNGAEVSVCFTEDGLERKNDPMSPGGGPIEKVPDLKAEEKFLKEEFGGLKEMKPQDALTTPPRKREKMEINYCVREATKTSGLVSAQTAPDVIPPTAIPKTLRGHSTTARAESPSQKVMSPAWAQQMNKREARKASPSRTSVAVTMDKRKTSPDVMGGFDVYNIETAMPSIDMDVIESHLRAANEEERRRRNDREEIRRRLAMGPDADDYYGERQGGRKPSLQSRLQSGMNLQICFMNETVSDGESPTASEYESQSSSPSSALSTSLPSSLPSSSLMPPPPPAASRSRNGGENEGIMAVGGPVASTAPQGAKAIPPHSLSLRSTLLPHGNTTMASHSLTLQHHPAALLGGVVGRWDVLGSGGHLEHTTKWDTEDFLGKQARLQAEARVALAQAKEMAHMQMEVERQRLKVNSPITQMVRTSLLKVGMVFPADRRRVSRQMLTEMNVAQLQVIVNDLHTQIEVLNEDLVKLLMERDDLHMEQDSMLVDIEDLTRYLGAKEKALKESGRAGACGPKRQCSEVGSRAVGSLPSLPLVFRQLPSNAAKPSQPRRRAGHE